MFAFLKINFLKVLIELLGLFVGELPLKFILVLNEVGLFFFERVGYLIVMQDLNEDLYFLFHKGVDAVDIGVENADSVGLYAVTYLLNA